MINPEQEPNQIENQEGIKQEKIKQAWDSLTNIEQMAVLRGMLDEFKTGFDQACEIKRLDAKSRADEESVKKYTIMTALRTLIEAGDIRTQIILNDVYGLIDKIELTDAEEKKSGKTTIEVQNELKEIFRRNVESRQNQ